jgi:hypothetical protein
MAPGPNTQVATTQCSLACPGTAAETCGAYARIDVWGPNPTAK